MEKLLELLKDGHARTVSMLAKELNTTSEDIRRKLEFMENMGIIRKIEITPASCAGGCGSCGGCSGSSGSCGCVGDCGDGGDVMNMGEMWEVVR